MPNKDIKTEPRFMTMIQKDLLPTCKALNLDVDPFANARTVFIDRDSVGRILSYMSDHEINPEWYGLLPDNLFVGTGLSQVELFARTMAQKAWKMNGEAIKFSNTGRLLDGQHRLLACVESGVPFRTLVIRGLPEDTQETMDAGKSRTMANVLELKGRNNAKQLSTVARSIYLSEQLGVEAACVNNMSPTRNELLTFIESTPQLEDTLRQASTFYTKSNHLMSTSMAALLYWTFNEIDGEACERFFDMLASGANLDEGSPILVLRNTLFDINKRGAHSDRPTRRRIVGITIKAWNKWRGGATVKLLKFSPNEQFPDAI